MNQKKLKSTIAKLVKAIMGPRKIEPGYFHTTGQEPEMSSFNLDLLGDPHDNDLFSQMGFWDKGTKLPENGLIDLYLYTLGFYGELDTNLLVRIKDGRPIQFFENSESPENEMPLVARDPKTLTPFTVREAREFMGISEDDIQVRTFRALTHQATSPQTVTILPNAFYDFSREDVPTIDGFNRVQGREVKAQDQVHISGTGWVKLIGEVS